MANFDFAAGLVRRSLGPSTFERHRHRYDLILAPQRFLPRQSQEQKAQILALAEDFPVVEGPRHHRSGPQADGSVDIGGRYLEQRPP
jgi:hypothetical protein